ncbi:MAG: metallopeptidase family protein [Verrucomicrobiota bacterium]
MNEPTPSAPRLPGYWNQLLRLAQDEVRATLDELPPLLRERAAQVPVVYEPRPSADLVRDGIEADTLGLFIGEAYPDSASGAIQLPAQVILYLDNLWDFAEGDEEIFCEEVSTTLMHELGHYLGLDEDDLEERGLD